MSRTGPRMALALPVIVLFAAGCGIGGKGDTAAGSASSPAPTSAANTQLAAMVPADVAKDGKLVIGTDATYVPNEFVDNSGQTVGMDIDLGRAISQELGLTADFQTAGSGDIMAGLVSNRFELAMSSLSITTSRLQTIDMVSYFTAGTSLATLKGNPTGLTLNTLCGQTVAVRQGTPQADDLAARSAACRLNGTLEITIRRLHTQSDVLRAVTSEQADAMLADSPFVDYTVKQTGGQIQKTSDSYANAPYGIGVAKGRGTFAQAVKDAVQELIGDGVYQQILDKWGVGAGAVSTSEVDPQPAG